MSGFLTVAQVAELLLVDVGKVHDWISGGDLAAVNVTRVRGTRARWRISREALDAFLASRGNRMAPPPAPRATRRRAEAVTQYFR